MTIDLTGLTSDVVTIGVALLSVSVTILGFRVVRSMLGRSGEGSWTYDQGGGSEEWWYGENGVWSRMDGTDVPINDEEQYGGWEP